MAGAGILSRIKILVVDDDPTIGGLMIDLLHKEGCQPAYYNHPLGALEWSAKNSFDLAFVDMNMPEMNGLELAMELKKLNPSGEIVFITGFGSFDNAIQAIKVGAYDYLRKPFSISELKLCLNRFQERQELKEKVRFAEYRYFNLVQNIPSLVFVLQRNFELEFINRACEQMLGYAPEEALNTQEWLLGRIYPDDLERIKRLFHTAFESRSSRFSAECRLIHKDGHLIYAMLSATAHVAIKEDNNTDRVEGIIVDITDRIFSEKAVVQKEKLRILNSISAEVAHEIRNPLVSIGGFARRLRKRFPELREGDIILRESERLEKLLKRIAEYIKPVEVHYQRCSINNVVTECLDQLTSVEESYKSKYEINLAPDLEEVVIDKQLLSDVFLDLIRNASNEIERGDKMNIRTFGSDKNLHIEFKNNCNKMTSNDREPFFLPFDESGHEITLPRSYRLLKNMGGLLSFSQGKKEMSFTVTLPKKVVAVSEMDGAIAS